MHSYGLVRVAAAVFNVKVADCKYNASCIIDIIHKVDQMGAQILVLPELCITSYTCGDLFHQQTLLENALLELKNILQFTSNIEMVSIVGCPIKVGSQLFNCAVIMQYGKILGIVPKTHLPGYGEFYEERWFASSNELPVSQIRLLNEENIPIGKDMIFRDGDVCFAVEICEDLWAPIPQSTYSALQGASILFNLSASNEVIGKYQYRKQLISQQSASCIAAYVYVSAGCSESSTDLVFGGHATIYEYGQQLCESKRFNKDNKVIYSDIDVDMLNNLRIKNTVFCECSGKENRYRQIGFTLKPLDVTDIKREVNPHPFIPSDAKLRYERCMEIFEMQTTALATRIEHTGSKSMVIGVSGGLDSTLALLVAANVCDKMSIPRTTVHGITMRGFGTSDTTYTNAKKLMSSLGITAMEVDITDCCNKHFEDIGHDANIHDVTFENVQARERTQILMDISNKTKGLVIGTADLSELALGWTTYNGDHMSMYGINCGVPKTLIRFLIENIASRDEKLSDVLKGILDTPVTPELLPIGNNGEIVQKTEDILGPYELHDFFLYHMIRNSHSPQKILFLAKHAFRDKFSKDFIKKCLETFYRRFFSNQFKRSCIPDGPKIGTISLSPRGDWRMPSDASVNLWLEDLSKA